MIFEFIFLYSLCFFFNWKLTNPFLDSFFSLQIDRFTVVRQAGDNRCKDSSLFKRRCLVKYIEENTKPETSLAQFVAFGSSLSLFFFVLVLFFNLKVRFFDCQTVLELRDAFAFVFVTELFRVELSTITPISIELLAVEGV